MNKNKKSFVYYFLDRNKLSIKVIRIKKNSPFEVGIIRNKMERKLFDLMSKDFKKDFPKIRVLQYLNSKKEVLHHHKPGLDYKLEQL